MLDKKLMKLKDMSSIIDKNLLPDFESVKDDDEEILWTDRNNKIYSGRTESNDGITTKLYDRWEAISNSYGVFKQFKKVSLDIKTDFNYPNALRPKTNPGYSTKYKPKN